MVGAWGYGMMDGAGRASPCRSPIIKPPVAISCQGQHLLAHHLCFAIGFAMAPKANVASLVKARGELVRLNLVAGMVRGSPEHLTLSKSSATTLGAAIRAAKALGADEANDILQMLLEMPLADTDRQALVRDVNAKAMQSSEAEACPASKLKQEMPQPELWLTAKDWATLTNVGSSTNDRLWCLAHRFLAMGHWYPSPFAVRNIVALAFHDQGAPHTLVAAAVAFNKVYKAHIKTARLKRSAVQPLPGDHAWEAGPHAFLAANEYWFNQAFPNSDEGVVTSPIDSARLDAYRSVFGCRTTKAGADMGKAPASVVALPKAPQFDATQVVHRLLNQFKPTHSMEACPIQMAPGLRGVEACPIQMVQGRQPLEAGPTQALHGVEACPIRMQPFGSQSSGSASDLQLAIPMQQPTGAALQALPPVDLAETQEADGRHMDDSLAPAVARPAAPAAEAAPACDPEGMMLAVAHLKANQRAHGHEEEGEEVQLKDEKQGEDSPLQKRSKPVKRSPQRIFPVRSKALAPALVSSDDTAASSGGGSPLKKFKLPAGWKTYSKKREVGETAGKVDTYFIAPDGARLRSMKAVMQKLGTLSRKA